MTVPTIRQNLAKSRLMAWLTPSHWEELGILIDYPHPVTIADKERMLISILDRVEDGAGNSANNEGV